MLIASVTLPPCDCAVTRRERRCTRISRAGACTGASARAHPAHAGGGASALNWGATRSTARRRRPLVEVGLWFLGAGGGGAPGGLRGGEVVHKVAGGRDRRVRAYVGR